MSLEVLGNLADLIYEQLKFYKSKIIVKMWIDKFDNEWMLKIE